MQADPTQRTGHRGDVAFELRADDEVFKFSRQWPGLAFQLVRTAIWRASLTACCGVLSQGRP